MRSPQATTRRDWQVMFAGWLLLALTAWVRPLMLPDEGRYVGVAWEMLQRGDWLVPTLDGLPFFHKPPLFYWITEAALAVFGPVEWACRAAPLIGAGLGLSALYLLTVRWASRDLARHALIALLAQPLFYLGAQFANLDMLVAGCITATIALLADAILSSEAGVPWRRAVLGAYAMAAFGVLSKGLIGIVLPGLVIVAWLAASRRLRLLPKLLSLPGLALLVVITAPWFLLMEHRHEGFLDYFFVVQHFKRYAAGGFNNAQPAWFYFGLLFVFFLPWLAWIYQLVRAVPAAGEGRDLRILMAVWAAAIVIFFSIPQSKLIGYVLPAVPPLAWLAADGFRASGRWPRMWEGVAVSLVLVSMITLLSLASHPVHSNKALATVLRDDRRPAEPVVMVGGYHYDVPFYARLREPAYVVEDWRSPDVQKRDNWRKELADAGKFDPTHAQQQLILPKELVTLLCSMPRTWVVGPEEIVGQQPLLTRALVVSAEGPLRLWRFDRSEATDGCQRTPTGVQPGS